jgi:hypothetical protein
MLCTLSERKLSERIRELENINDSVEEIVDRMPHFAARLFAHIAAYGVRMVGMVGQNGGLGTFQFALSPIFNEEDRATRINGLNLMNPNSVTVESGDLPALVPPGLIQTMLIDEWHTFSARLNKVLPSDIGGIIESAAQNCMKQPSSVDFGDQELNDEYFADFLQRAGKKDPMARINAVDEYRRREEAAVLAQKNAGFEAFLNGE